MHLIQPVGGGEGSCEDIRGGCAAPALADDADGTDDVAGGADAVCVVMGEFLGELSPMVSFGAFSAMF